MFHSQWLICLGVLEAAAIAVALLSVARSGLARRFPSLAFALAVELASDVALDVMLHRPNLYTDYFWIYWASVFLLSAIRLWIIVDVVRSFPGIGFLPRSVYLFVGTSGLAMAAASVAYSLHGSGLCPQMTNLLSSKASLYCFIACMRNDAAPVVILIDRCVCVAWMAFYFSLLLSIKILRLGWSSAGAHVANGITARICACLVVSWLLSSPSAHIRLLANIFDSLCSIAVFLFWFYQFSRPLQIPESEGDDQYMQASLDDLLAISAGRER